MGVELHRLKGIIKQMQKPQFVNNEFYHIYNRGVEKRDVFIDDKDYLRFIHDLFEFNNEDLTFNTDYYFNKTTRQTMVVQLPYIITERKPRKLLVEIGAFCQMPNHYHLILKQKQKNGIVRFMQKLGTGYTNYFNKKEERVGSLFQGRFKAVHINREEHLQYLLFYIHLNPLDLIESGWRMGEIKNYQKAIMFLKKYRWSSYLDFLGQKNFPSVTQRDFILKIFGGQQNYQLNIKQWLKEISRAQEIDPKEFQAVVFD